LKKISYFIPSSFYLENALFDINNTNVNRDGCVYAFHSLREYFWKRGCDLATFDLSPLDNSVAVIYHDMPSKLPEKNNINKSYLILFESEVIKSDNWDVEKHQFFRKIFTWRDELIDNKKYFKINFSHLIPLVIDKDITQKHKLCTLIAGNKKVSHPLELYSERLCAIQWFEKHHPDDFDFYGVGWDEASFDNKYLNFFMKKIGLSQVLGKRYVSYGGRVASKLEVLKQYKFAICYENARDISGYITEKIFDCFFAGCVPIYWGANNVTDHIPPECFIDRRNFSSYEALYDFISTMTDAEYLGYLSHIESYLRSERIKPFSAEYFAETIVHGVVEDLGT